MSYGPKLLEDVYQSANNSPEVKPPPDSKFSERAESQKKSTEQQIAPKQQMNSPNDVDLVDVKYLCAFRKSY